MPEVADILGNTNCASLSASVLSRLRPTFDAGRNRTQVAAVMNLRGSQPAFHDPQTVISTSVMPTVLRSGPYRINFHSHEPNEPPHMHIDREDMSAKFWLDPVGLVRNFGFAPRELRRLQSLVEENRIQLLEAWYGYFAVAADERVKQVRVDSDSISVDRWMDAQSVCLLPGIRGFECNPKQRSHWKIAGAGYGIHWPDIDEDLSTEGLLRGGTGTQAC